MQNKKNPTLNIPISPFPPRHRIPTSNPQLLTLPTNRRIPTTLRLALSARLTSPRHPPTIARGRVRPLAGDRHLAIVDQLFLPGDIGSMLRAWCCGWLRRRQCGSWEGRDVGCRDDVEVALGLLQRHFVSRRNCPVFLFLEKCGGYLHACICFVQDVDMGRAITFHFADKGERKSLCFPARERYLGREGQMRGALAEKKYIASN